MKSLLLFFAMLVAIPSYGREWNSLRSYQKETNQQQLSPSDWLASDRRQNTLIWNNANKFNLLNNKPKEYLSIKQRRDFYLWLHNELEKKGHDVVWPYMAYFISHKLRLVNNVPYRWFSSKAIKRYTDMGSEEVFNSAFIKLQEIYNSENLLRKNEAYSWDEKMLHDEQFIWVERVYEIMDDKSLKQIGRMAKGHFLYSIVVPKPIRFQGDISNAQERYSYALHTLRTYCKNQMH
ncbi:Insecticidal toxin complex protein [Geojedonia litorea]|uniref:Insecticidal toxin complex protein n=1 Tax=Geojedonia litorea TaxID=1268269 RepID=A0ABV9MYK3_9FLAO